MARSVLGSSLSCLLLSSLLLILRPTLAQDDDEPTSSTAQVSEAFVEPATGLTMERFFGARTSFGFAMTMPPTPTDSFIGRLDFPLVDGAGWGAMGLIGDMVSLFDTNTGIKLPSMLCQKHADRWPASRKTTSSSQLGPMVPAASWPPSGKAQTKTTHPRL